MNPQFPNGYPPNGPRPQSSESPNPNHPYPNQMPGGMTSSTGPYGPNVQGLYHPSGPSQHKPPYGVPPGPPNQSNVNYGSWDPSLTKDMNGVSRIPYNPNQLSSQFTNMQIGGAERTQNMNPQMMPPPNSSPPQPPADNSAFQQPLRPNYYSHQPQSSNVMQQLPPNQPYMNHHPTSNLDPPQMNHPMPPSTSINGPPPNFAPPQGFPPVEPPQMTGPLMKPRLNDAVPNSGPLPCNTNYGPSQFQPKNVSQGPPGGQWGGSNFTSQNPPAGYVDHNNSFNSLLSQSVTSQPYNAPPPSAGPGGFQGQRQKFPAASADGSYSGAPGFQQGPPYLSHGGMTAQPQQRRLDPDQMPSQIQVLENDKRSKGGTFQTGQKGNVPPLVTTDFIVEDMGTCSPRFFRSNTYSIPCSGDLLKQSHLPISVTLTPFARLHPRENPPPIVDLGQMGPVRCNRCKVYMCPGMIFVDGGRKFQCCFCNGLTEVPPEYFAHLDHTGRRFDCYDRPELCLGTYEFVAPIEYCQNDRPPQPPAFIFMIDVSCQSVKSGLVNLLCTRLKQDILPNLPKDIGDRESEIRVGFVTYGREIHFYNIKSNLAQPQMLVVSDIHDVFIPLVDGFLVKPSEAVPLIDGLLVQISEMFGNSQERESILYPVIEAGLDALKSSERNGKLFIFHCSIPTADAPGKLKLREDKSLLGTDKEKSLLTPQNKQYTKLAQNCISAGCSVDIFLFPTSYVDVATIAEVPRVTGGSLYKYNNFQADLDGDRLMNDLRINVERQVAFSVTLKLRTSTGIRPVDFLGNFHMDNTTEVELAALDQDKSIGIEIKHDDKLSEADGAMAQAVVLYTSVGGKRRLRILNMAFTCCTQVSDIFRFCELDALVNYLSKFAVRESLNSNVKQVKENLTNRCVQTLACYRKSCASPSSSGQLILPESMKLLPLYVNSMLNSSLFQSENINVDDRSYYINLVNSMNISDTVAFFYPRLLPLHELDLQSESLPPAVRCSYERLRENGAYVLENGLVMFLWMGLKISPEWIQKVFGVPSVAQVDIDKTKLEILDNPLSERVRGIVKMVREGRHRHMKLIIVRQRDRLEPVLQSYLVEDKSPLAPSSLSYVDFLCHIHKEIRNLLL